MSIMKPSHWIDMNTKLLYLIFGTIRWRKHPGCFERHLQRRYKNPLFPPERRIVTLLDLDVARQTDAAEKYAFYKKMKGALRDFPEDEEYPPQMIENIRNTYRQIGELIEESFSLGDSTLLERDQLLIYEKACLDFLLTHQPSQSESYLAIQALSDLTRITWYRQFTRPDSPITKDEDVASLLSEDAITIRNIGSYFTMAEHLNPTPVNIIDRKKMIDTVTQAYKEGLDRARGQRLLDAYNEGTSATMTQLKSK